MRHYYQQPGGHAHPLRPSNGVWPNEAHYAPGYPASSLDQTSIPVLQFPMPPAPFVAVFVPTPQHRIVRRSSSLDHMRPQFRFVSRSPSPEAKPPQLRRKISIPKKRVHFDLRPHPVPQQQAPHEPIQIRRVDRDHYPGPPTYYTPRRRSSRITLQDEPSASPPNPTQPTIWIVTFADTIATSPAAVHKILATELPPGTPHLYTIQAYSFIPPPADICREYSGVSSIVQDYVMKDAGARKAVADAIHDIVVHGRRELKKDKESGHPRPGRRDVALSVCCMYGTHRSVSIAERIAQGLMELGLGVKVVVRHVHRIRGVKDPR